MNFDKWVDEDEDDGVDGKDFDIQQMLANMGGGGMPDYSNMPQWDENDSDNEGMCRKKLVFNLIIHLRRHARARRS